MLNQISQKTIQEDKVKKLLEPLGLKSVWL
jgi:hypothetical protein